LASATTLEVLESRFNGLEHGSFRWMANALKLCRQIESLFDLCTAKALQSGGTPREAVTSRMSSVRAGKSGQTHSNTNLQFHLPIPHQTRG
jgi:hypothetical protein